MKAATCIAILGVSLKLVSAAPFQNLGFDQANTNRVVPDAGPVRRGIGPSEDLLPHWQLTKGGVVQPTLGLNLSSLALGTATLISADQSDFFQFPVEGAYALFFRGTPGNQEPFRLAQRGEVPLGIQWLSYDYHGYPMVVSINGTPLRPNLDTGQSQLFEVSMFAGQTIDLLLTSTGPLMPTQAGSTYLDSIAFAVPEPATTALLGLAALAFLVRRFSR